MESQRVLKEQDDDLDVLSSSVERIGQIAQGINSEIRLQNKFVDKSPNNGNFN
jgi:hypothetical protein